MKGVKKVTAFKCLVCGRIHERATDADKCSQRPEFKESEYLPGLMFRVHYTDKDKQPGKPAFAAILKSERTSGHRGNVLFRYAVDGIVFNKTAYDIEGRAKIFEHIDLVPARFQDISCKNFDVLYKDLASMNIIPLLYDEQAGIVKITNRAEGGDVMKKAQS